MAVHFIRIRSALSESHLESSRVTRWFLNQRLIFSSLTTCTDPLRDPSDLRAFYARNLPRSTVIQLFLQISVPSNSSSLLDSPYATLCPRASTSKIRISPPPTDTHHIFLWATPASGWRFRLRPPLSAVGLRKSGFLLQPTDIDPPVPRTATVCASVPAFGAADLPKFISTQATDTHHTPRWLTSACASVPSLGAVDLENFHLCSKQRAVTIHPWYAAALPHPRSTFKDIYLQTKSAPTHVHAPTGPLDDPRNRLRPRTQRCQSQKHPTDIDPPAPWTAILCASVPAFDLLKALSNQRALTPRYSGWPAPLPPSPHSAQSTFKEVPLFAPQSKGLRPLGLLNGPVRASVPTLGAVDLIKFILTQTTDTHLIVH
ncbi:hypothetical protein C8R46DRAFT_1221065 [Mycena filopes]|nr:hypothetical protein C8R46DRAFT_1221065 [Mycena filopes]